MNLRAIHQEIERGLARSWRTLGVPTTEEAIDERREGVVDPEALVVATLLYGSSPRLLGDLATWTRHCSDLLLHQKLASLVRVLKLEERLAPVMRKAELTGMSTKARAALGASRKVGGTKTALDRTDKLAPRNALARSSRMIFNRLLFGASARADIITTLQLRDPPRSGAALAELLAVDASTVSRILGDLRACDKLTQDLKLVDSKPFASGFFISTATLVHLQAIVDAAQVETEELRSAMLPDVDARTDGLGHALLQGFKTTRRQR